MNINKRAIEIGKNVTKSRKTMKNIRMRGKYVTTENNKTDNTRIKSD